jgi:HEAT repeat protein
VNDSTSLIRRVEQTTSGFADIRRAADETVATASPTRVRALADELVASPVYQARMLAIYLYGHAALTNTDCLQALRLQVSRDPDWRVQEILAQAFDLYCKGIGYANALPTITDWLEDAHANVRRAVTEGLRIWTARPYFREHPDQAIALLSARRADPSDYVRRSAGNALRDISKKHAALVAAALATWDLAQPGVAQTYALASRFIRKNECSGARG